MCVAIFLKNPMTYQGSHGSHKQNTNHIGDILAPTSLWFLFITYKYINKVCDVRNDPQSPNYRVFGAHRFISLYVRNKCVRAKSLIRLHEVQGLNKNLVSLTGSLQYK